MMSNDNDNEIKREQAANSAFDNFLEAIDITKNDK